MFDPIVFRPGVSVVVAEIRLPENKGLDTHNLGKTTVGQLIDYCLLKGKSQEFFLFKHAQFSEFTFYLELELLDGTYVTICRPVTPGSKVYIKRSISSLPDASLIPLEEWEFQKLSFERAKTVLDGILDLTALSPWSYRKLIGYLIRTQKDYLDVFQLGKFSGKHQDWKPFVAHLLGVASGNVTRLYDQREKVAQIEGHLRSVSKEWGGDDSDPSILDGLIAVKRSELASRQRVLDTLNFRTDDARVNGELVDRIESEIVELNEQLYTSTQLIARLKESLEQEQIIFRPAEAEKLFAEAGIYFSAELMKDYQQLVTFNRSITSERREALEYQLAETESLVERLGNRLSELNAEREKSLAFLLESESMQKFRSVSREVSGIEAELAVLEARHQSAMRLVELRREQREAAEELGKLQTSVEAEIVELSQDPESRFAKMRGYFNEIISAVVGQNAILAMKLNGEGGLDFTAEFVSDTGTATSGDRGTSYKKLLCIAFDLALLRAHLDVKFARFVYHDGALEQLEARKREKLVGVFHEYAELGIQPVFSTLDEALPGPDAPSNERIPTNEVILTLHDENDLGRLFKMPSW
ncbi:DUF2326 domain-containing protein [Agromyces sp. NPDC058136]|uniref:DUF2326 domain-containing protein n=1 Tax=Agromyces sp. NPDC058136 TaxID=3346354 RepID=UPI0036DC7AAC